ncbi:MAG: class I SAM-dependent methyltransferase [Alphaproteobacteria bacterium]
MEKQGFDQAKLDAFLGQMLSDLGGAMSVALVRMGETLGLYKALDDGGPATSAELAARTGLAERYLREWLSAQAASNYIAYDGATGRFSLPPEQAMVFAREDSPAYLMGGFDACVVTILNQGTIEKAFRSGAGVSWGAQPDCLFCATAKFFRPGYNANLVQSWLPALEGVAEKLERGARVADVGCGHGISTVIMAEAFPKSEFVGFDFHEGSIKAAAAHAAQHNLAGNASFKVGLAKEFDGKGSFDLVCFFDCLHDMGDPAGAAKHVRQSLKPDGTWMIVEPMAKDRLEENLNPVSRLYYSASTMVCVPTSLAQEVGAALGAQAGETRLRDVIGQGGFTRIRRAAETPFNVVLEARP